MSTIANIGSNLLPLVGHIPGGELTILYAVWSR